MSGQTAGFTANASIHVVSSGDPDQCSAEEMPGKRPVSFSEITIILPALNEAENIAAVVRDVREALPGAEVLVIDDGSADETAQLAASAGAEVLSHDRQRGYGAALRTGVESSDRTYVAFCDADGQHAAGDLARLIREVDGADIVVGVRGRDSHAPWIRRPGMLVLKWFGDFLAGERIPDLNSGMRVMRRAILLKYLHLMPRGFSFSTTSTFSFLKGGHRINWVPIKVRKREGQSSVRQWKHGPQTFMLMLRLTVLFEPLKVFLSVDAVLLLLTFCSLALDVSVNKDSGIGDVTVALSLATMTVFLFGLLCDQVSALRREIHE